MDALQVAQATLRAEGFSVYDPGEFAGVCKAPYVVLRYSGTYASFAGNKVGSSVIEAHCFVPLTEYAKLAPYKASVKATLRRLQHQLKPTGHESNDGIEQAYKAHSAYIEYQVLKRL